MAIGNRDTRDIIVSTGVDPTALLNYRIADGTTYEAIVSLMAAGLNGVRNEITGDPTFAGLIYTDAEPQVEYSVGGGNAMEEFSENANANMQRASTEGHMIPLAPYDYGLGWTWRYLEKARMSQVRADVTAALNSVRNRYRISILTRLLKRGDDSGANIGLGASGLSPGFATTAASTGVDFVPPAYGGKTFLNTHEHYGAVAGSSGAITTTQISAMREHLREHGHAEPYELLISSDDRAVYEALSGFVFAIDSSIRQYASTTALAAVSLQDGYIGYLLGFKIKVQPGMPRYWHFGYKSYGANSPLNPIYVRLPQGQSSLDLRILTRGASPADPLRDLYLFTEFGVGVGQDRTNGVVYYSNSGTWADGTPT